MDHAAGLGLRHPFPPRLRLDAEPFGTVRWSHASLLLSIACLPSEACFVACGVSQAAGRLGAPRGGSASSTACSLIPQCRCVNRKMASRQNCDRNDFVPMLWTCRSAAIPAITLSAARSAFVLCACRGAAKAVKPSPEAGVTRRGGENTYMKGWLGLPAIPTM